MVDSHVYPGLERKPGVQNWVDAAGGLPDYIERIAKHLHYEKGMSISRAIASAVNTVKRWARMGKVAKYGDPNHKHVSAKTAALAAKAVAEWYAKRKAGSLAMSEDLANFIDLTEVSEEYALHLAGEIYKQYGTLDLADADVGESDTMVALMVPPDIAKELAVDGGVPPEDMHLTLTFHGPTTPEQYQKVCEDLRAWAADGGPGELSGHIGGVGQFPPTDSGKVPHFAPADVPGLNSLHENVKAVTSKTAPASEDHGYTPHMTLTYGDEAPAPVSPTQVKFSEMHVVRGNKQRTAIPLSSDTRDKAGGGARRTSRGRLRAGNVKLSEGGMDLQALAERANRIEDPVLRDAARRRIIDLAVNPSAEQRKRYGMADGSFPVWDRASLHSAILLTRTPAQRRHVIAAARRLGLTSMIPNAWTKVSLSELAMVGIVDLASTIAPRRPSGRVSDGRRSYRRQGKWGHGFVPLDQAAKESKAKGSPIAIKRLNRKYAGGRAGQRSAPVKNNPKSVAVDEKSQPGSESAKSIGALRHSPFGGPENKNQVKGGYKRQLPKSQKEASKSSRVPNRARQNWDEIPSNLKTVRNGKRYVYAEYGGKGFITPWVGGVHQVSGGTLDQRKIYRTLSTATAMAMTPAQLRDLMNNPQVSDEVKRVARRALKKMAEAAK